MIPSPFHGIFSSSLTATQRNSQENGDRNACEGESGTEPPVRHKEKPKVLQDHRSAAQGTFAAGKAGSSSSGQARSGAVGQVALDIFEHDNYYIIKAPIAGVRLQDLDIEVNDNVITIRGTRRQVDDVPTDQYYLQECFWGPFERSVTLPCSVDARRVKATFNKDAVLKIIVPKEEKIKIIRIND
ncbi:MAG: Hsp20/alpha crystallin family protein [Candidatus Peribacteraceae bacterium]|nr:Hsp20/alpha crystallin family protein [Candidatus Peribacteraceae bacterium]